MTNQPIRKLVQNLGDVNPIEYGGFFVYEDTTGVYPEEAEKLIPFEDEEKEKWEVRRFVLDRLKTVEQFGERYLVPFEYAEDWPHSVSRYDEWFHKDLSSVASFIGQTTEDLEQSFCSDNPLIRAYAYSAIGEYFGFDNVDSYPLIFTDRAEIESRYQEKNR